MKDDDRMHPFRHSGQDKEASHRLPDTQQAQSPSYRLAFDDPDFLLRDELRPVRLQLELLKPEMLMAEYGVESTIVLFGGSRIPEPSQRDGARTETLAGAGHILNLDEPAAFDAAILRFLDELQARAA